MLFFSNNFSSFYNSEEITNNHNNGDLYDVINQERQRVFILSNSENSLFRFRTEVKKTPRRNPEFKHGAEMFIGLYDGIRVFLDDRLGGKYLKKIEQLKFKKTIHGSNIIYSIYQSRQEDKENIASIFGSFKDDEGTKYYYYGEELPGGNIDKAICKEYYLQLLGNTKANKLQKGESQEFTLQAINNIISSAEIQELEKQSEIVISYLLDVINIIFYNGTKMSGLVADYKDLLFHTAVDHNKLINGGYKILVQIEDEFKSNTSGFHFYIYTFKITEDNNDVISGKVKFAGINKNSL